MADKAPQIPPPTFFDLLSQLFSRRDQLLEYIAKTDRQIADALISWLTSQGIAVPPSLTVEITPPTPAPTIPVIIPGIRVTPTPTGPIVAPGTLATPTTSYAAVASYTPTQGKRFQIAKIAASCSEDIIIQLFWGGQALSIPYYVMAKLPFTDWFPLNYYLTTHQEYLRGDGSIKLELKAKIPSGGTAAQVDAEIVGEETEQPS